MKCEDCRERLWAYLEGELDAAEAAETERHLAACGDCREELSLRQEIMETLRSLPDAELPAGYHEELMEKLRTAAEPQVIPFPQKKKTTKWKQMSLIAAAVLIVVAAGGVQGMQKMRQGQNEINQQMEMAADAVTESAPAETAVENIEMDEGAQPLEAQTKAEQPVAGQAKAEQPVADDSEIAGKPAEGGQKAKAAGGGEAAQYVVENKAGKADAKKDIADNAKADTGAYAADTAETEETAMESAPENAETTPYSMRAAAPMTAAEALDAATLRAADPVAALEAIRGEIAAAQGYEEFASAENSIFAMIPKENYADFRKAVETLGELQWTKTGTPTEADAYHSVEITVEQK